MAIVTLQDIRRHDPGPPDPYWQESYFMGWYDVRHRIGGHHHISLCPYQRLAHVWSFISVDGQVIARSQEPALPIPESDFDDMRLGVLRFVQGETWRKVALTVQGDAGDRVELSYEGYTDPFCLDFNTGGLKLGSGHYESMGRLTGKLVRGGRETPILGSAWHDHSWGPRKLSSHKSGRYFWASFGDDLAMSIYGIDDAGGKNRFGYVLDHGVVHPIADATFGAVVADDGVSPRACDAEVWTQSGRAYHVTGRADSNALVGGSGWADGGYFFGMNGLMRYECGGRIGEGLFELTELRSPTEAHRKELNLGPEDK